MPNSLPRTSHNETGEPIGASPRTVRELTLFGSPKDTRTAHACTSLTLTPSAEPYVLAVSTSSGGIPKHPIPAGFVSQVGLVGDGHNHAKHIRPDRAVSLFDQEVLQQLVQEGFLLVPGAAGENLTVTGLNVQTMTSGTLLKIGEVILRLEQPRKPCYVLDAIDPRLKDAIVGRCGYMASVYREGLIRPGMAVEVIG